MAWVKIMQKIIEETKIIAGYIAMIQDTEGNWIGLHSSE